MNADEYSDGYEDRETVYECSHKCSKHKCVSKSGRILKPLKFNRTHLKCGMSSGSFTLPVDTPAGVTFTLATVNADTKGMNQPCIQLEYASNIFTAAESLTLNFQIFKQCGNQLAPVPVGPVWTFFAEVTEGSTLSNPFAFSVCDCDIICDECCIYSAAVTIEGVSITALTIISNSSLAAIIVDDSCKY